MKRVQSVTLNIKNKSDVHNKTHTEMDLFFAPFDLVHFIDCSSCMFFASIIFCVSFLIWFDFQSGSEALISSILCFLANFLPPIALKILTVCLLFCVFIIVLAKTVSGACT